LPRRAIGHRQVERDRAGNIRVNPESNLVCSIRDRLTESDVPLSGPDCRLRVWDDRDLVALKLGE
jgi:hypothetical protein